MNDSEDGTERSEHSRRSRRLFMRSAGVAGLGLTAGATVATSREDAESEDDGDADSATETDDCPPTEIESGVHKLLPGDGEAGDDFGDSVSIDGDTALVAPGDVPDSVSAYVFSYDGDRWCQEAKLVADGGGTGGDDELYYNDSSVHLDGDTAIVGDVNDNETSLRAGAAYVFTRSEGSWAQQAKLLADDGQRYDRFGISVSADGDTALVGAHLEDERGFQAGAAYVFTRSGDTWSQQAKLLADDGGNFHLFGLSTSLDGDTALVGAAYNDENGIWAGAAYVFTRGRDAWSQQAKLLAEDGGRLDRFGRAVSVDRDTALVGADGNGENGRDAGAAYVFTRSRESWSQQMKLLAEDGEAREHFGWSASLDGDRAVVGTWDQFRGGATATGAAYAFARSDGSWSRQAKLLAVDGEAGDNFGQAVSLHDETALAGAGGSDVAGAAYAFDLSAWEPTRPDDGETDDEPTEIDSCTVISEPGEYELVTDLAPDELDEPACIVIDSDDVTLRGNGHTIDASDATYEDPGTFSNFERPPCIAVHPYTNGLGEDDWNTVVEDVVVRGSYAGVTAQLSGGGRYTDVRVVDNDNGFLFETDGGTLQNCVVENNDRGVTVAVAEGPRGSFRADLEDCTLRSNGTGLWVDREMDATVVGTRIVENGTGVLAAPFAHEADRSPPTVSIESSHVCRNEHYGVRARTDPSADEDAAAETAREGVVVAVDNYWGAANGPSSFGDPSEPYADPETGRPADGDGDAVSQSLESGVSNVRFDPFLESALDGVGTDR